MNVVLATRPPGPVTRTPNAPSWSAPGKSLLMSSWKVPADGVMRTVRVNVRAGTICGGLSKRSATVTGLAGAKPLTWTAHAVPVVPWLCFTMHASGPLAA